MAKDFLNDLTRAAGQYVAMKAAYGIGGGGLSGVLLSSIATQSIGRLFQPNSERAGDSERPSSPDDGPERVGQRIGEAAAEAIKKILDDYLKGRPQPNTATNAPPASQGSSSSGPRLPKPKDNQSAEDYINSLSKEELETLRNGGKEIPTIPPKKPPTATAGGTASKVAQAEAGEAAAAGAGRAGAGTAARAGATAGAGAGASGGAAAGGAAAVAGPAVAALAVTYVFYELVKAGKELAYEQEKLSRRLGEVNPAIGGQQAELDANRTFRDMATGDRLAQSNAQLLGAIDRYEKALRPFEEFTDRIKNLIGSEVLGGIAASLENLEKVAEAAYSLIPSRFKKYKTWEDLKNSGAVSSGMAFGDFMADVERQERENRERGAQRMKEARGIMNGGANW